MSGNKGFGLFGHVPTPEEINARAFAMDRDAQPHGWWPGYVAGLRDAGKVSDEQGTQLLMAALNGQFAHNLEPMFGSEVPDEVER